MNRRRRHTPVRTLRVLCRVLLTLAAVCAGLGCVVPEDIQVRPSTEPVETDYWPVFISPQPVSQGTLTLPASCATYAFRIQLIALPPADDPDYADFDVRWYLDYDENQDLFATSYTGSLSQEVPIYPSDLYKRPRADGDPHHVLEVLVSDKGFESLSSIEPRHRKPKSGARTALYSWTFVLDPEAGGSCP